MNLFLQLLGNGIAQGAVAMLYAAGFGFGCLAENAYGGSAPQLTDGDVFRTEVSLKALEVALIGQGVAQRLHIVKEKLKGLGRTDAIENAIAVLGLLLEDGQLSIPDIESRTHFSNGSVKNAIRLLRVNGLIKREGPRRGGRWGVLA